MNQINGAKEIERLLKFALKKHMIDFYDVIPVRNLLMDLLHINEPYLGEAEEEELSAPTDILQNLLDYAAEAGIIETNTTTFRDLLDAKIMGLVMPRQSEVIRAFKNTEKDEGIEKATEEFYALSKASNYIRMDRINRNIYWQTMTEYGPLEITINLSKPEKDPKDIAAAKSVPQLNYPKCLLCIENVGYAGNVKHPARQNHRVIPVTIAEEQWFLQYSPYVYYNEHCILFKGEHVPMKISEKTFERLFDFVEQFPHYFIGSNADLPIVGGSILSHEHFQGGRHVFPMETAPVQKEFFSPQHKEVKIAIIKWPLSVIRLSARDKGQLLALSNKILKEWRQYTDEAVDIRAVSSIDNADVPHNTVTPIARRNHKGEFEIDLVLRNNRTSQEHPDGIFHPHKELHHIKKENIGLIEVMGLAVLPERLERELNEIEKTITGAESLDSINDKPELIKHKPWIEEMLKRYGTVSKAAAKDLLKQEVGYKFEKVLLDAGVYKNNEAGLAAFSKFMLQVGFTEA